MRPEETYNIAQAMNRLYCGVCSKVRFSGNTMLHYRVNQGVLQWVFNNSLNVWQDNISPADEIAKYTRATMWCLD